MLPFIILAVNTLLFWFIATILHRQKHKISIIPLYCFLAFLTIVTHILSLANLNLTFSNYFFLVSSTAYFTPLLLIVFMLYLFEGIHATRKGLEVIIGSSILLVAVIAFSSFEDTNNVFIVSTYATYINLFWSVLATIIDVVLIVFGWELLNRVKKIPLVISITFLLLIVYTADTFIFVTGVFYADKFYWDIIRSDLVVRAVLSILIGFFLSRYLASVKYSEEKREKPRSVWQIIDFRSEDEKQVSELNTYIKEKEIMEVELLHSRELYKSVLAAVDVGIWDWNIITGEITWSPRSYSLLGYTPAELPSLNFNNFLTMVHADDTSLVKEALERHMVNKTPYHVEYRLKTKSEGYKWFSAHGIAKFDTKDEPIRMVGSLVDINDKKILEQKLNDRIAELSEVNKVFLGRELRMIELKDELKKYEEPAQPSKPTPQP